MMLCASCTNNKHLISDEAERAAVQQDFEARRDTLTLSLIHIYHIEEPFIAATIITATDYIGPIMTLCLGCLLYTSPLCSRPAVKAYLLKSTGWWKKVFSSYVFIRITFKFEIITLLKKGCTNNCFRSDEQRTRIAFYMSPCFLCSFVFLP